MEVFATPTLGPEEHHALKLIEGLRTDLRFRVAAPKRWNHSLRRMALARAVQGSNSIEGYHASLDDVAAAVDGEPTLDTTEETAQALAGYRDAMTYVLQVAQDERAVIDEGLIKALHFMMLKHDLPKSPGRWRPGYIQVHDDARSVTVYEGPDAELVDPLVRSMLEDLATSTAPVLVRAAMAHLNLVMIHPFRDGNGRMARCLQTLVLARENIAAPVFSSIEEYLGRNTPAYYAVLADVGAGAWNPGRDARPWLRFCITAHYRQAKTQLQRIAEIEQLWAACSAIAAEHDLPERVTGPLLDAALGLRLRNATYRKSVAEGEGEEISDLSASRDLRALVDARLLTAHGRNRGRYYTAQDEILAVQQRIRSERPPQEQFDPFAVPQPELPLPGS